MTGGKCSFYKFIIKILIFCKLFSNSSNLFMTFLLYQHMHYYCIEILIEPL